MSIEDDGGFLFPYLEHQQRHAAKEKHAYDIETFGVGEEGGLLVHDAFHGSVCEAMGFFQWESFGEEVVGVHAEPFVEGGVVLGDVVQQVDAVKDHPVLYEGGHQCNAEGAAQLSHHVVQSGALRHVVHLHVRQGHGGKRHKKESQTDAPEQERDVEIVGTGR